MAMTRPGGPAAPPGASVGDRIVQEWGERMHDHPSWDDWRDLARRIDAALAAREAEVTSLRLNFNRLCAGEYRALDAEWQPVFDRVAQAETALAEREAELCALRDALLIAEARTSGHDADPITVALRDTADAAARFVARARQEGAEEMRQAAQSAVQQEAQAASLSDRWDAGYRRACDNIVQILGALDAGEPTARRG